MSRGRPTGARRSAARLMISPVLPVCIHHLSKVADGPHFSPGCRSGWRGRSASQCDRWQGSYPSWRSFRSPKPVNAPLACRETWVTLRAALAAAPRGAPPNADGGTACQDLDLAEPSRIPTAAAASMHPRHPADIHAHPRLNPRFRPRVQPRVCNPACSFLVRAGRLSCLLESGPVSLKLASSAFVDQIEWDSDTKRLAGASVGNYVGLGRALACLPGTARE